MANGYHQLPITPFNPPDTGQDLQRMVQLRNLMANAPVQRQILQQQAQAGQLGIQEQQYQIGARQAVNQAYANAIKIGENGQPSFDTDALTKHLSDAGYGSEAPTILQHLTAYEKTKADAAEAQNKVIAASKDSLGYLGRAVQQANYDPQLAQTILEHGLADPTLQPQARGQLMQLRAQMAQNPALIKTFADNAVAQSPEQQKQATERQVATIRASKPPEGELPLGDKVASLNQAMAQRYQVLNPGKPLPPFLTLPPTATQKDFDRVDKLMQQTESAQGTKAQQDTANAMRQESQRMAQQSQAERLEQQGLQPIVGTDPKTGKDVLVSASDAKSLGLTGAMKADADLVNKSHAARTWLSLASKEAPAGAPADQMGIMQLVDKMDAAGKLGPIASRWNDFLTGKIGAGDPDYAALRAKMGLSATKLMQAHVGSRGGAFMLEHFEDLANAGKMDATTLKAGLASELNYMQDVAMLPQRGAAQPAARKSTGPSDLGPVPAGATHIVPGRDGKNHYTNAAGTVDLGIAP